MNKRLILCIFSLFVVSTCSGIDAQPNSVVPAQPDTFVQPGPPPVQQQQFYRYHQYPNNSYYYNYNRPNNTYYSHYDPRSNTYYYYNYDYNYPATPPDQPLQYGTKWQQQYNKPR